MGVNRTCRRADETDLIAARWFTERVVFPSALWARSRADSMLTCAGHVLASLVSEVACTSIADAVIRSG